jgi:WD40 repeat protein
VSRSRKIVLSFAAALGGTTCVFLVAVLVGQGLDRASLWATVLGLPAGVVAAGAAVWALVLQRPKVLAPTELKVPEWVVERPAEVEEVAAALVGGRDRTVGITTGLQGAGGFGKTTLARMVCADRRVQRAFKGYTYPVTVGRDVRDAAALVAKVNEVIKLVAGEDATFTDPQLAGLRLGSLLDTGPRRLLVLDDVWESAQLAPFVCGGRRCARLVTTRVPGLLAGQGVAVRVDQMSPEQARRLLTSGLPPMAPKVAEGLLTVTGRWPLLLRLVNKTLANAARTTPDVSAAGQQLCDRLREGGPTAVDDLLASSGLEVDQPEKRAQAVRATIRASTSLLDPEDAERFTELALFPVDETIPFGLVARLWQATAGLDPLQASQVCARLVELALVSADGSDPGGVTLHDVMRDFLRGELGPHLLARLHGVLLDAVATDLPTASPLDAADPGQAQVAWWDLGGERYLWDHLIGHLLDADRRSDAEWVACDLRWVAARLQRFGPAAPFADLSLVHTPRADRLRLVLARAAHLLTPIEPTETLVDVLHSRIADDRDWGPQVTALRDTRGRPRLVNRWALPDQPDSAFRRILTGHTDWVNAVAIAPDGSWLATGSNDETVRIWDAATGQPEATLTSDKGRAVLTRLKRRLALNGFRGWSPLTSYKGWAAIAGYPGWVRAVAIAPDGSWLASGSVDRTVRIWDAATGRLKASLTGHQHWVNAVAIAPDGSWLATGSNDETVRIWDAVTGQARALLTGHKGLAPLPGHNGAVNAVAIAPDGSWLATGGGDRTVRIWDAVTGQERATLTGHYLAVNAVAIAPDGSWLATGGADQTVRIWDAVTGQERATLTCDWGAVKAVAIAPDGSWLATGGADRTVRIWDAVTGQERATFTGHNDRPARGGYLGEVGAVAIAPDGTWLATGGDDETVRIWDVATGQAQATPTGRNDRPNLLRYKSEVQAVAIAPDGSWLATGSSDCTLRTWDAASGEARATLRAHSLRVTAVAIAPDGTWLVTAGDDRTVRIWDVATWQPWSFPTRPNGLATLTDDRMGFVSAMVFAPDGTWLATGGSGDRAVRIWDAVTGQERATLTGHYDRVTAVAVAPDGSWLASSSWDGTVRIWDVATGQARATLTGHRDSVRAVAVAPDGSWLTSGGADMTVRIWDAATGQTRATLTGHNDHVTAVAIAQDGSWLATGSDDETVRIWDVATGQTQALMRVEGAIFACAWLGVGGLAVGGRGGVYLFDFLADHAQRSARHRQG